MRNAIMVGDRVYLRPLETSDADVMTAGLTHDPETFFERGRFPVSPIAFEHTFEESQKADIPNEAAFAVC